LDKIVPQNDAEFMRSLLAASDDCIKVIDLDGNLAYMSEGGQRVMEVSDFNAIKGCPWPDFWAGPGNLAANAAIEAARNGKSSRFQGAANTHAGNPRHWDVQVAPLFGPDGKPKSILSVSRDITKLKAAEDQLRLVSLELKHRMKNTIAMIQAIANQTFKAGGDIMDAKGVFMGRLGTLSSAQDLLTQTDWASALMRPLVESATATHGDARRFKINGPDLRLSSKCALGLALALHELGTNATKYGALKDECGYVAISWGVETGGRFGFTWREHDGPPVTPPTRTGFGSRMIERSLAGYFNGEAKIDYSETGIVFLLDCPLTALTAE
jgi:PAS domain S-box-containing protein